MQKRYNPTVRQLVNKALALATLDGGFVIAVQVFAFLCTYFSLQGQSVVTLQSFNLSNFLVSLINMLNLSVIIFRIAGLTRGLKYSFSICYQQGLKRLPSLISLYIIVSFLLLAIMIPFTKVFATLSIAPLLIMLILALLPFGIIACSFVIDQDMKPLKALRETYQVLKNKISPKLAITLALAYSLPLSIIALVATPENMHIIDLLNQIWILFCHIMAITVYAETSAKQAVNPNKNIKVIVA